MDLERLKQDIVFQERIRGISLTFHTTWGIFSPKAIDAGTRLLVEKMDIRETDICLDLGCGYGAPGLYMARLARQGHVYMCDKDCVAVKYARMNARINHIKNCDVYLSNGFEELPPEIRFDVIASNLPAKAGKELLILWMHEAKARLRKGGRFYVVTLSGIRQFIKRHFKEIFGNYEKVKQSRAHTVSLAIMQPDMPFGRTHRSSEHDVFSVPDDL